MSSSEVEKQLQESYNEGLALNRLDTLEECGATHIDASKAPQWLVDALVRLEAMGRVVSRPVTIHYGTDSDGVEATTNYIGFFLK